MGDVVPEVWNVLAIKVGLLHIISMWLIKMKLFSVLIYLSVMEEKWRHSWSHTPRLISGCEQSKSQRYSVYCHVKRREVEISVIWEVVTSECLSFLAETIYWSSKQLAINLIRIDFVISKIGLQLKIVFTFNSILIMFAINQSVVQSMKCQKYWTMPIRVF